MDEPFEHDVILSDVSPNGNLVAWVDQDDRVVYFYLGGGEESDFPMKCCWVRNLVPGPEEIDMEGMGEGIPPLLPRRFTTHPQGASPLRGDELRVVWFEEENCGAGILPALPILQARRLRHKKGEPP